MSGQVGKVRPAKNEEMASDVMRVAVEEGSGGWVGGWVVCWFLEFESSFLLPL
jgi:hypothetical protein